MHRIELTREAQTPGLCFAGDTSLVFEIAPALIVAGGGAAYVHEQAAPARVWTIDHGFAYWPITYVLDTNGDECEGEVSNPALGRTVITFSAAFAGTARLI